MYKLLFTAICLIVIGFDFVAQGNASPLLPHKLGPKCKQVILQSAFGFHDFSKGYSSRWLSATDCDHNGFIALLSRNGHLIEIKGTYGSGMYVFDNTYEVDERDKETAASWHVTDDVLVCEVRENYYMITDIKEDESVYATLRGTD